MARKKKLDDGGWGEVVSEAPRAKVESERSKTAKQFALKVLIWSILLTWPILALSAVKSMVSPPQAPPAPEAPQLTSPGRFAAEQRIKEWLAGDPTPLPGGRIISFDGSTAVVSSSIKDLNGQTKVVASGPPNTKVTTENFTLADSSGRGFKASVQVATDVIGGSTAISGVSLMPAPAPLALDYAGMSPWPGLAIQSNPSSGIQTAVKAWLAAYTGGDDDALRQIVGDTDATHVYRALRDVETATGEARQTAGLDATGSKALVRVEVALKWKGTAKPEQTKTPVLSTFDLLVDRADSGAPTVVAWGAPGAGPELKAYANAITLPKDSPELKEPKADASATASPSPTATATP